MAFVAGILLLSMKVKSTIDIERRCWTTESNKLKLQLWPQIGIPEIDQKVSSHAQIGPLEAKNHLSKVEVGGKAINQTVLI